MKILFSFIQIEKKSSQIYRENFSLQILFSLITMYGVRCLWIALYSQNADIVGRSIQSMTTYAMMAMALDMVFYPSVLKSAPHNYLSAQIRSGSIESDLLKPVDLQFFLFCQNAANALFSVLWYTLPTCLISIIIFDMSIPPTKTHVLLFLLSAFFSFCVLFSLNFFIGLLTFFTIENRELVMAYSGVIAILSGKVIPIWLFPRWLQVLVRWLPFHHIYETPLNIYTGVDTVNEAVSLLFQQGVWALFLILCGHVLWIKTRKHLVIQGG